MIAHCIRFWPAYAWLKTAVEQGRYGRPDRTDFYAAGLWRRRLVSAVASWLIPKSYGFSMSYRVIFEASAAVFEGDTLTLYPAEGDAFAAELVPGDGYTGEHPANRRDCSG